MHPWSCSTLVAAALALRASAAVYQRHDHAHEVARKLPSDSWYQRDDHPVYALFRRDGQPTDGATYAQVGSAEWVAAYPAASPTPTQMPVEWLNALNDTIARGLIPDIPLTTVANKDDGIPVYPSGFDPNTPQVCSATYQCMIDGDIWNAPDGHIALSFDDGPQPASDGLSSFLAANKQTATHFLIGSNIIQFPTQFTNAFNAGDDICVHTWTHPYMTTLSNEDVLSELGWTIELIHNSTGGRVPKFWRPPYGDSDVRTRAIAKEVFGLTTVIWNQDTNDWSLTDKPPGTTAAKINASMTQWLTGPKSPGLIILEHELSNQSVDAFIAAYPNMINPANGWTVTSLATLMGNGSVYQNAASDTSAVTPVSNIINAVNVSIPATSSIGGVAAASSPDAANPSVTAAASTASKPSGAAPRAMASAGLTTLLLGVAIILSA